jgi:hypothetical protein
MRVLILIASITISAIVVLAAPANQNPLGNNGVGISPEEASGILADLGVRSEDGGPPGRYVPRTKQGMPYSKRELDPKTPEILNTEFVAIDVETEIVLLESINKRQLPCPLPCQRRPALD